MMNGAVERRATVLPGWIVFLGGLAGAILALPLLSFPFGVDQGIFATAADTLRRGGVLYRDAWDNKPPGIYLTYFTAFLTLGRHLWSVRLFEIAAMGITSAGLARIGTRRFGSVISALVAAAAYPCLYLVIPPPGTAHTEAFQMPFLVWSLALWPSGETSGSVRLRCFFSGLLLSVACCYKSPACIFAGLLLGERILTDWRNSGGRTAWAPSGAMFLGLLLPPVVLLSYYSARGAAEETLDAWVYFPARYAALPSDRSWPDRLLSTWSILVGSLSAWGLVLLTAGALRGWSRRPRETARWAAATAVGFWVIAAQGKFFDYHHVILFPFLALGLGLGFTAPAPESPPEPAPRAWALRAVFAVLLLSASLSVGGRLRGVWAGAGRVAEIRMPEEPRPRTLGYPGDHALALLVRARTEPQDRVFIWGTRPLIYYMSERPVAGPYTHMIHMAPPWASQDHRLDRLLLRLDRDRPRLVIVCPRDWEWWCNETVGRILDRCPDIREFIRDHYTRTEVLEECEVWTRN